MWVRSRRAFRVRELDRAWCTGVIASDDEPTDVIGCIEVSWLRGPRTLLRPFTVTTSWGDLPVPSGARLLAPMPLLTSVLRSGESVVVLRRGDRVVLGGFVERTDGDHPFRGSAAPIPGPDGIVVTPSTNATYGFTHTALGMWRPSVAYLLILTAVAIPSLLAVIAPSRY